MKLVQLTDNHYMNIKLVDEISAERQGSVLIEMESKAHLAGDCVGKEELDNDVEEKERCNMMKAQEKPAREDNPAGYVENGIDSLDVGILNKPLPDGKDLFNQARSLAANMKAIGQKILSSDPVEIDPWLKNPTFRFIKVGITPGDLIQGARVGGYFANKLMRGLSQEDLSTFAKKVISIYTKESIEQAKTRTYSGKEYNDAALIVKGHDVDGFAELAQTHSLQFCINGMNDLLKSMKKPREFGWQNPDRGTQYKFDDSKLLEWISEGTGYGVVAGPGGLRMFDADNYEAMKQYIPFQFDLLVKTGRVNGAGKHLYFVSPTLGEKYNKGKISLFQKEVNIGELKLSKSQCVGPTSWHPSGNRYEVVT